MTMRRYRVVHRTQFAYDAPIRLSHNEARMTPVTEPGQTTLENRLRVKPMTWSHVYRDHWGTHVTALESLSAHSSLELEAVSTVEKFDLPAPGESLGWTALEDEAVRDRSWEWLMSTDRTHAGEGIVALAEQARGDATPREAAFRLAELARSQLTYRRGVTGVHSDCEQAWAERAGVCQDFAHVTIAALRHLGIPARYVSGYLVPQRGSEVGQTSVGESHAWVEFHDGDWLAIDPTNGTIVGLDHIVVARGRDYDDVPPFKGIYAGAGKSSLAVAVEVTRLA